MEYEVFIKDGILHIVPGDGSDEERVTADLERVQQLVRDSRLCPLLLLVDLRNVAGRNTTPRERRLIADATKEDKVSKIALVGGNTFSRTVARFIAGVAGRADVTKFFASYQDAIDWLKKIPEK